ncbi:ABC transporter ATP-binding protein [Mesorhizobium sp. L-8-10]|uniref:ABC transporter ATP-binding protein n=1 Tax=unclassified Mesorhizobium TaxID=325217 RepID=UPI0019261FEE|nr:MULTISPECIES: ABC transporter ATP-binding protein [unclassified Mesorhizobium]BCH28027.1 ABC transporter ATP-binding protein [Mesorhizobium sp. L-8-3]BCH35901.1 ABC transporter ATP-binding protein [Mesorhizobium sp. L-8-10]
MSARLDATPLSGHTEAPLVDIEGLARVFDLSKRWLNRMLDGSGKVTLTAVDGVALSIRRGETYALVGESGSGKSTIARMAVGLLPPSAGTVRIADADIWAERSAARQRRIRRQIQMIFQDPFASLNPRWRVGAIVAEPIKAFGLKADAREREQRVGELLSLVGLDPRDAGKFPHEFSGGQRQRIAIARALASEPDFIVCDEPTSALDVSVQAQVLNLLRDLQQSLGLTYLFISHNLAVVRHMASRVGVLYLGRLVEEAPAAMLFAQPKHPYTRMLLDAVPDISMETVEREPIAGEIPNPIKPPRGCHFHPRCPHVMERCRTETPPVYNAEGTAVRCHLYAPEAKG